MIPIFMKNIRLSSSSLTLSIFIMAKKLFRIQLRPNRITCPVNPGTIFRILFLFLFAITQLPAQSSSILDSLLTASKTLPDSPEKIKTLHLIGYNYRKSSPEKASNYFHQAIVLGNKLNEKHYTTSTYSQLTLLHNNLGNRDSTDYYLEKTKGLVEKYPDETKPSSYYQAAGLVYKNRGDYEKAIEITKKQIEYLESSNGDKITLAGAYHNLSANYWLMKNLSTAIEYQFKALELFSAGGSEEGVAYSNTSLGNIYHDLGQDQEAIKYHTRSLDYKKKQGDKRGMAVSYLNMSTANLGLKNYEKAMEYVNKALPLNKELKLRAEEVKNIWQIAIINREKNDTIAALSAFDKAIKLAKEYDNVNLASEIQRGKDNFLPNPIKENPLSGLLENLKVSEEKQDSLQITNSLKELTTWYYDKQNYKEAFAYQQKHYEMQKSMFGPEVLNRMKQLENKYEVSQRENTITLLKKEKEINESKMERQRIALYGSIGIVLLILLITYLLFNRNRILQENRRIVELEKVRNDIASDLHDDVGSTISSIQIISEILKKTSHKNPKTLQAAGHISDLSGKVASGLQEIIWATNPQNDKVEAILLEMHKYSAEIQRNQECVFSFKEKIQTPELIVGSNIRKNLMMIFKESINNACKYSGSPRMEIFVSQNKKRLKIKIQDFGCGFEPDMITRGNGMTNMKNRASEIGAKLAIISEQNIGTTIKLNIPLP